MNVCTFTRMQMKQVIKDVARALSVPYEEVNLFTSMIPDKDAEGNPIEHVDNLESLPGAQEFMSKYPDVIKYAKILEGTPRQISQHPAGIGILPFEVTDLIPVVKAKAIESDIEPGYLSQYEKDNFELSGIVKIDILRIACVTQLDLMLKLLRQYYPVQAMELMNGEIKDENIPLDDPKSYQLLCDLDITGIFQLDNEKISKPILQKIQPRNIHEMAATTALIRPGAGNLDPYLEAKNFPDKRIYVDPRIDRFLNESYGVILYQENHMQIISTILGISFGQADIFRRALEKPKKFPEKYQEFLDTFIPKGVENGFSEKVCEYLQKTILESANYGFNRSHAYAYSFLTMQMAWVKANFPMAFYCAMLDYDISKFNMYKSEAENKGIKILGPHVNKSNKHTLISSIEDNEIRTGLNQIKGLGDAAIDIIIANQPYNSINDFMTRAANRAVNKRIIETLIKNDCFEGLPFIFEDETLTEESPFYGRKPLYLSRGELLQWFEYYYAMKNQKAEKNYIVLKDSLPRSLQEDRQLVFEKDNTIIVPFSKLNEFHVFGSNADGSFTDEEIKQLISTRKKPKGRLAVYKEINSLTPILKPFLNYEQIILDAKKTNWQMFVEDINEKDISFRIHPLALEKQSIAKLSSAYEGQQVHIAGYVSSFEERSRIKDGRQIHYYIMNIITPYENITQFLFDKDVSTAGNILKKGNFISYYGLKDNRGGVKNRYGWELISRQWIEERESATYQETIRYNKYE